MNYLQVNYDHNISPVVRETEKYKLNMIIDKFFPEQAMRVLDVGSGNGMTIKHLRTRFSDCHAVDYDDYFSKHLVLNGITFTKINMETEPLPYADNFFDVIITQQTLEHLRDTNNFFEEAYRTLKKNGRVIIVVPNIRRIKYNFWDAPTHHTPFTKGRVRESFRQYGFNTIKVSCFDLPLNMGLGLLEAYKLFPGLFFIGTSILGVGEKP